jgi:hypothetical protein
VLRWATGRRLLAVPSCDALRPSNQFRFPAHEVNCEKPAYRSTFFSPSWMLRTPVAALPDQAALLSCSVTSFGLDVFMFAPRDKNYHRSTAA